MRQLQKVLWTKGVLLTPHHLQLQDRFTEDLIAFQLSALIPYAYGFSALEIDLEALDGGVFSLTRASGRFTDGLLFDVPGSDPAPPERPLDDLWGPDQQTLQMHLAIPEFRLEGRNVSGDVHGRDTRFSPEVAFLRDENTGLGEKPVEVARKNIWLAVEGESMEGHSTLPVARIRRSTAGGYELDSHFIPPLLDLDASPHLLSVVRRLVELLSAKSDELSGARRQRGKSLADFGISDIASFWLLYTANTYLPVFRHIHDLRRGHPLLLFQTMLELAGALTTFSNEVSPADFPLYRHSNLTDTFGALDRQLQALLQTVIPKHCDTMSLEAITEYTYGTSITDSRHLAAREYYLAVRADVDPAALVHDVPRLVKIGTREQVEKQHQFGLESLELLPIPDPPTEVPVKLDYRYFRLDTSGDGWSDIVRAQNIAAYVPDTIRNPTLELLVLLPRER
jgi:type VI secretion system protein ImpJ